MKQQILFTFDERTHATVMAALRFYQNCGGIEFAARNQELKDIATNCDTVVPLDSDEIDDLVLRFNFTPGAELVAISPPVLCETNVCMHHTEATSEARVYGGIAGKFCPTCDFELYIPEQEETI